MSKRKFNYAKIGAAQRRSRPSAELLNIANVYGAVVSLPDGEAADRVLSVFDPVFARRGYNVDQVESAWRDWLLCGPWRPALG